MVLFLIFKKGKNLFEVSLPLVTFCCVLSLTLSKRIMILEETPVDTGSTFFRSLRTIRILKKILSPQGPKESAFFRILTVRKILKKVLYYDLAAASARSAKS